MKAFLLSVPLAAVCAFAQTSPDLLTLRSPNGEIQFQLFLTQQPDTSEPYNRLAYQVSFKGKSLMDTSFMGLNIQDQPILGVNVGLESSKTASVDETYTVPAGKTKTIRDHYNSLTAQYLQNGTLGRRITIEVRAYDDGIAFRYVVPWANPLADMQIVDEFTEFQFAQDAETYPLILKEFQTPYEDQYSRLTLSGIHPDLLIGLPFLVEQPGVGWVAVTEAGIDNYAGMYLQHEDGRIMISTLPTRLDEPTLAVHTAAPMSCPWRVLMIGTEPGKLIESNIVSNLNPPSAIVDTSWIKPGKAASSGAGADMTSIERLIDFAADSKLEYTVIDGGGTPGNSPTASAIEMPEILRYAKAKGVGVWLSVPWQSIQRQTEVAFALYEKWGVAGLEIDGMNRDDQWVVNFDREMAKVAAAHHLMLDFHGAYKPDGLSRTWPNVLTREAVMGEAYNKTSARVTPDHDVMLAFTRMLAGPMDYSPGGFDNVTRADFRPREKRPMTMGTRAHQLALYVVFDSPLQMVSGDPEAYAGQKDFDFVKEVPAAWDETRAVAGKVGEFVALARKKGADWYLGAITNWDARELSVPLAFLGPGEYTAEIYSDAADADANPKHTSMERRRVTAATRLAVNLASGGGVAVRFSPVK